MWALIENDQSAIRKRRPNVDPAISLTSPAGHSKPYWVPIEEEITDNSTGPDIVAGPWIETIEVNRVLRARTIRDKTPGELDAEDQAVVDIALANTNLFRALLRWVFDAENRIRILEGNPTIDEATFRNAIKNRIRN